ncbi:erythromycin esterase family protein, partial [Actinomadura adrarensis]
APRWGAPFEVMNVPKPRHGSLEEVMVESEMERGLFVFSDRPEASWLNATRGHRAIGVVYDPTRDHQQNYVPTRLADRYDALCWFRRTSALEPLHLETARSDELETLPSGV